jgi:hypothetical protein
MFVIIAHFYYTSRSSFQIKFPLLRLLICANIVFYILSFLVTEERFKRATLDIKTNIKEDRVKRLLSRKLYVENKKSKSFLAISVAERDNSQLFYSGDAAPKVRRQLAQGPRSSPSFERTPGKTVAYDLLKVRDVSTGLG